jgi:predicted DCC family thiol-disulfide oxidoreductase YuxK
LKTTFGTAPRGLHSERSPRGRYIHSVRVSIRSLTVQRLYVLYDARCGLCRWAMRWVETKEQLVEVKFLAAGSIEAVERFPSLSRSETPDDLVAVSDEGGVYLNGSAWVMVLYALAEYREWSLRLGSPALLPLARRAFGLLSRHRHELSGWLHADMSEGEVRKTLEAAPPDVCDLGAAVAENPAAPAGPVMPRGGLGRPERWDRRFTL